MKRIVVVFVVLSTVLGGLLFWKLRRQEAELNRAPGSAAVVEGTRVAVATKVGARIKVLTPREGDAVKAGDVVAQLDCADTEAAIAEATARIEAAKVQVDLARAQAETAGLQARAAARQVAASKAQIGSVRAQGENARRQNERALRLKEIEAVSVQSWEGADTAVRDLDHRLEATAEAAEAAAFQARAAERLAAAAPDQVRLAERQVEAAEATLARLKTALAECTIAAPRAGVVTVRAHEPGEVVLPGATLLEITDDAELKATFYVANDDLGKVAVGATVAAEADAFPGVRFEGVVRRVGRQAEYTPRTIQTRTDRERLVYAVEADLRNPDGKLRTGMPVEVRVEGK